MAPEEYIALVDELGGTTGESRTMLHDTRAGELMEHNVFRRAWQNAHSLINAGHVARSAPAPATMAPSLCPRTKLAPQPATPTTHS